VFVAYRRFLIPPFPNIAAMSYSSEQNRISEQNRTEIEQNRTQNRTEFKTVSEQNSEQNFEFVKNLKLRLLIDKKLFSKHH
jgi:hypothetical protein